MNGRGGRGSHTQRCNPVLSQERIPMVLGLALAGRLFPEGSIYICIHVSIYIYTYGTHFVAQSIQAGPAFGCLEFPLISIKGPRLPAGGQSSESSELTSRAENAQPTTLTVHMGGCQNCGPFLVLSRIRHLIFTGPTKGP